MAPDKKTPDKKKFRQIAVKKTIKELLQGEYNYINLIAIILNKEKLGTITNFLLDDGSGKIIFRSFEEKTVLNNLAVGQVVLIIGKIRIYNQEKYISPEIIKVVGPLWLKARSLELKNIVKSKPPLIKSEQTIKIKKEDQKPLPTQKLIQIIQKLDGGEGVLIEKLIKESPLKETEQIIEKMIKNGDIFQNLPGKVKVL